MALLGVGAYSFLHVNVEAYPDPAPPIVEIVATTNGMLHRCPLCGRKRL
jgi:cobalt-zinc-cadmium resistance protein CzcA